MSDALPAELRHHTGADLQFWKCHPACQCSTLTFLLICPLGNQVSHSFSCPCVCFDYPPPSKHPSCIHCPITHTILTKKCSMFISLTQSGFNEILFPSHGKSFSHEVWYLRRLLLLLPGFSADSSSNLFSLASGPVSASSLSFSFRVFLENPN